MKTKEKKYVYSSICKMLGQNHVEILTEEELPKLHRLEWDIPKKVNSSKTLYQTDTFSGVTFINTLTRIS